MNAAAREYLATRVLTASPHSLHLLVVEGALRHARTAEAALEAGDRDAAVEALSQARAFVGELLGGLQGDRAPEIAANMASLFTFAYRRLVEGELHGSADSIRDAIKVLQLHRETWLQLLELPGSSVAMSGAEAVAEEAAPTPTLRSVPAEYDDYQPRSWCG